MTRRDLVRLCVLSLCALASPRAVAGEAINARPGGLAVNGYDVVAYFTLGRPVEGDPQYELEWRGVRWRFASAAHLEAFKQEPGRYAPRYGGFCAGGMALGRRAPIDPEAFVIHRGRLYLHFDGSSAAKMEAGPDAMVEKADENWARLGRAE